MAPVSASYEASSVRLIVEEAQRRGIKVMNYDFIRLGFVRLTLGDHTEYIFQSQSDIQGRATARFFTDNKVLGTYVLREAGFPVPDDVLAATFSEAEAFMKTYGKIVVKPINGSGGQGITLQVETEERLREAMATARAATYGEGEEVRVVCQEHVEGRDYRLLVIDYEHIFVSERIPAHVVGDGVLTVDELREKHNSGVMPGYEIARTVAGDRLLQEAGLSWGAVPAVGVNVRLAQVANAHAGGLVREAGADLGEAAREAALRLVRHFKLRIVGLDCLTDDLNTGIGKILELNLCPAIFIHHYPNIGEAKDTTPYILNMLFPETRNLF